MTTPTGLDTARAVADAVLYEGYLLYPYRSTSAKNQIRWQFGVLAPPGAAADGLGEDSDLAMQCLVRCERGGAITMTLRFLQLQVRSIEQRTPDGWQPRSEFVVGQQVWLSWDEAVEQELTFGPFDADALHAGLELAVAVPGGEEVELLQDDAGETVGRVVRRRDPLAGVTRLSVDSAGPLSRLSITVDNTAGRVSDKAAAIRRSFIGTHLLLQALGAEFISMIDPPDEAKPAAAQCVHRRCWPVLAGYAGATNILLGLPIILSDYPELATQSAGALFDSTEIDEILTLRVMTMTNQEKAQARATDPRAAAIIDRCDAMSAQDLQALHGVLRDPHAGTSMITGDDWWAAEAAAEVSPETDEIIVGTTRVAKGSIVRLRPSRRADAQDIFFAGQIARVSAVHVDLDGETHVAVTLLADPAADLHDWYGRYLYFAPDELETLSAEEQYEEQLKLAEEMS
jgi:hypothetical protein